MKGQSNGLRSENRGGHILLLIILLPDTSLKSAIGRPCSVSSNIVLLDECKLVYFIC
jgi:hypothetical protein